jgi:hypothetical protein
MRVARFHHACRRRGRVAIGGADADELAADGILASGAHLAENPFIVDGSHHATDGLAEHGT